MTFTFPRDRYYDPVNHMWVRMQSGQASIGIDALGLETLGDLAYITLPDVGAPVKRGQPCGTMEAAKMTSELIAPISGTLVARNEKVLRDPSLVNREGYGEAWLIAIQPSRWTAESAALVYGDAIPAWVEAEVKRYREQGWIHD